MVMRYIHSIEPMTEGLIRQRRNLLIICSILLFIKLSGLTVSKIHLVGMEFEDLENPHAIYLFVWAAFFYFVWRYVQYFSQEGMVYVMEAGRIRMNYVIVKSIDKELKRSMPEGYRSVMSVKDIAYEFCENNKSELKVGCKPAVLSSGEKNIVIKMGWFRRSVLAVRSTVYVAFFTSSHTDYLLPIIYATLTLFYCFSGSESALSSVAERLISNT